jgi:hypothetical protein
MALTVGRRAAAEDLASRGTHDCRVVIDMDQGTRCRYRVRPSIVFRDTASESPGAQTDGTGPARHIREGDPMRGGPRGGGTFIYRDPAY